MTGDVSHRPRPLDDPDLPAVGVLLGEEAPDFLEAAVGETGDTITSFRTVQVRYIPRKSITVQYLLQVDGGEGVGVAPVTLVAASGLDLPDGVAVMSSGDMEIALWRFPEDPFLPGLASATDKGRAGRLLERLGASSNGLQLRTRAYRPGRRAVVEAATEDARIFMKVLRPFKTRELQEHHVRLASHVRVPHSLGWSEELGVVALEALPGQTLRSAIESERDALPDPRALVELLDSFPDDRAGDPVRGPWRRAATHARTLHALVPEEGEAIDRIVDALADLDGDEPLVPVHGDFHTSQVLVDGDEIVGVVDVDTAGRGHRSDDLANILGHIATVTTISRARPALQRYGATLIRHFDTLVDPGLLRKKVAATVFGLASGPFRVQEPSWWERIARRLRLTERWLESAEKGA